MPNEISSSTLVRQGLKYEPVGTPWPVAGICSLCAKNIEQGELASELNLSAGFTDSLSLTHRGEHMLMCGDCAPLMGTTGLLQSGYGVFTATAAIPFRKWADIAAALLNPPREPFVMVYSNAKSQHMAWRAPVNYSPDVFRVRVGLRDLLIRREKLVEAPPICERLARAAFPKYFERLGDKPQKGKTLPNPFAELAPDLKSMQHGLLHPALLKLNADSPSAYAGLAEDIAWAKGLTAGETWGLRFVLTPGAGTSTSSDQ